LDPAVRRECLAARDGVALLDASTLGKIEVSGPDAARFLERMYINRWSNLATGRCRYGVMCRDDGMVFDDGVGTRLAADRFFITTTTGNASAVLDWFEEWLQTEWPALDVFCTSLTEEFANATLVGPAAGQVLATLAPRLDLAAFPFMAMREADIAGIPARVFRVSFSGELSYEVNVPGAAGQALWERLMAAGEPHGITPYGTEAMHVLRAEKGYFMVGQDTDGSVTPLDLGLTVKAEDFLGRRSLARPDTARADRKQLVGLLPDDPSLVFAEGAQLIAEPQSTAMLGHVTSSYFGARIGRGFALALVQGGRQLHGAPVWAFHGGGTFPVRICSPIFYDPEGQRRDG
jgi:sarcosine oxidase subunit alpha